MSSTYKVLCLSHDPATVAADGDWNRASMAEEAIAAGLEDHKDCDLLIGRYSYPLIEVGCPASVTKRGPGGCCHASTKWVDGGWLRLLSYAQREPTGTDLRHAADEAARLCWPVERLRRLGAELGVATVAEPKSVPSDVAELEHRLALAHRSRRASEHLLDGIRRALCDAGFMRDDDPYGHADLAGVIRQAGDADAKVRAEPGPLCALCGGMKHCTCGTLAVCVSRWLDPQGVRIVCEAGHRPGDDHRNGKYRWPYVWPGDEELGVQVDRAPRFGDPVRISFVTTFDKRDSTGRYMLLEPAGTVLTGGATVEVIGRAGGAE